MTIETKLQNLKREGRRLIGCFPLYPPLELFHSLGLTPVVLWGFRRPSTSLSRADRHLQPFACSVARHMMECILSQKEESLDGLFMYNACDTLRNLPEILLSGLREQARFLPLVKTHIPQVPPEQTAWGDYFRGKITALIRNLEETFQVDYAPESFHRSVALYGRMRSLCLALEERTAEGGISYALFSQTVQEGWFRPVEEQINLLEQILAKTPPGRADRSNPAITDPVFKDRVITDRVIPGDPVITDRISPEDPAITGRISPEDPAITGRISPEDPAIPILVSGILPPSPAQIRTMEECGLRVTGNDIASQRRSYGYQPSEGLEPADYYLDFYAGHVPCPTLLYTADRRPETLERLAADSGARGLLFLGQKFCEYEYFEFPFLERRLLEKGLAVATFEMAGEEENQAPFATRLQAFAEMLREQGG